MGQINFIKGFIGEKFKFGSPIQIKLRRLEFQETKFNFYQVNLLKSWAKWQENQSFKVN